MTTTTITDGALLHLLAWLSPAFPTGGYAWSQGIEWAVETGDIRDGATLAAWLRDVLRAGAGWNDVVFLRLAHAAWDDAAALAEIAERAAATAPSKERLSETLSQGTAFLAAARAWAPPTFPAPLAYPVAVGAVCGAAGIAQDAVAAGFLQAQAASLISAAVRLVPLGQSAGLAVLAALEPDLLAVANASRVASADDLGGVGWRADIAAMRHETQYTRLFRS